jgi:DNA replication and repair protein RecF
VLRSIHVENLRCIADAALEFDAQATGIVGANASGKTSLLESVFFLAHGRSFRTPQREKLVRAGAAYLRVVASLDDVARTLIVGAEYRDEVLTIHVGGHPVSTISEVAARLPVQVIDPGVHRLIEEGSARRRRLLDWGVFHVEHMFLDAWRRYQRALQQRNAALRQGCTEDLLVAWDSELAVSADLVDAHRAAYFAQLAPELQTFIKQLVNIEVTVEYHRGWSADEPLSDALKRVRARDFRVKTTTLGAHRADLQFLVGRAPARDRISRGQQKMLASAFVLASVAASRGAHSKPMCLLLDDPAAELDVDNLGKLLSALRSVHAQLVVTAVTEAGLKGLPIGRGFHVEQGRVRPML